MLDAGLVAWPPRLPDQPIFYPVLNLDYAVQITRDWNAAGEGQVGYATRFELDDAYAARFAPQIVGRRDHAELWVPAEELAELNRHIRGHITVERAFFGPKFRGLVPERGVWSALDAGAQLADLTKRVSVGDQLDLVVAANRNAVFLHLPYWDTLNSSVATAVRAAWRSQFPSLPAA